MLVLLSGNLFLCRVHFFFANEPLQLSLFNKSFYLLLQVIAVGCVMIVVTVEAVVLVSGSLIRISLQLAGKCQGSFVIDLHQDLVNLGSQRGEAYEPPMGGLERLSSHRSPVLAIFRPLSCHTSSCLSFFLGFSSRASSASSTFMYLVDL